MLNNKSSAELVQLVLSIVLGEHMSHDKMLLYDNESLSILFNYKQVYEENCDLFFLTDIIS